MLFDLIYRYGSFDAYFIPNALTGKTRRPRRGIPAIAIKISIMSFPSIARLLLNTKKGFQQKPKALNYQWWTIEELNF
jgi:phosphoheptose isomerase